MHCSPVAPVAVTAVADDEDNAAADAAVLFAFLFEYCLRRGDALIILPLAV